MSKSEVGYTMAFGIEASASALGTVQITNSDVEEAIDRRAGWIMERTGIRSRRRFPEITSELDILRDLVKIIADENLHIDLSSIDTVIVATTTPDQTSPPLAVELAALLNCRPKRAYDLNGACAGALHAIEIARSYNETGSSERALVVGIDRFSRRVDPTDPRTAPLFGDGAAAILLGPQSSGTFIGSTSLTDPDYRDAAVFSTAGPDQFFTMNGGLLLTGVTKIMTDTLHELNDAVSAQVPSERDVMTYVTRTIMHHGNPKMGAMLIDALGLPNGLDHVSLLPQFGNLAAASVIAGIDYAVRNPSNHHHRPDDLWLIASVGAGITSNAFFYAPTTGSWARR